MQFQYFKKIQELLDIVMEEEKDNISKAVKLITDANVNRNAIWVFGASHAGILSEELYYRAGGMITINAIFGREVMLDRQPISFTSKMERLEGYGVNLASTIPFCSNDVLILHSVSGRNPIIIDLALSAKKKGVKILALTNLSYSKSITSRHSSGKKLFEIADIVIDNHGEIGDGSCSIPGVLQKAGPTSTVIGATVLNSIIVDVFENMVAQGITNPPIFYSANIDGGDEKNVQLYKEYRDVVHYKLL